MWTKSHLTLTKQRWRRQMRKWAPAPGSQQTRGPLSHPAGFCSCCSISSPFAMLATPHQLCLSSTLKWPPSCIPELLSGVHTPVAGIPAFCSSWDTGIDQGSLEVIWVCVSQCPAHSTKANTWAGGCENKTRSLVLVSNICCKLYCPFVF